MTQEGTEIETDNELLKIIEARHHDPFSILGRHEKGNGHAVVRVFLPGASSVRILDIGQEMSRLKGTDIFQWEGPGDSLPGHYRIWWQDLEGMEHVYHDPYSFPPLIPEFDLGLFAAGKHWHIYRILGAHKYEVDGIPGVLFAVWAPNAERVSVVGDFNSWDGRRHPMRIRQDYGTWELFIPDLTPGGVYKYEIRNRETGMVFLKTDPYAQQLEIRPKEAAIITDEPRHVWNDDEWTEDRKAFDWQHSKISIYEVHLGSWQRGPEGEFLNYRELARRLVPYVKELGFTHIELLPITEHPFDLSWGYQSTGYFAPTSRFGTPDDFRFFVDFCHEHRIGVFLDWVPAHFPKDAHGLARFDGTPLYEHEDPRLGEHLDWSTLIFNYGRNEVKNFLLSSAVFWLEEFHIDGLRVDAVASMLYLDYSRTDWVPNRFGGRENLEAIDFLRGLNEVTHGQFPGVLIMAEESTAWPQVTRPTYVGGLGFDLKWNMGWMNDTLEYMSKDPVHRKYHHDMLTFSLLYAFSENFLLPLSHDEVVHGKGSLLNKMPGDEWQAFANLRLLYTYMFTHPGKKLLFMGCEFAQKSEWNSAGTLEWNVIEYPLHKGVMSLVKDLNGLCGRLASLHYFDFDWKGFEWIDSNDAVQSVLTYIRKKGDDFLVIALNFTPVPRENYQVGVPAGGRYREIFNSDSAFYGGSNLGNGGLDIVAENKEWMGRPFSVRLTIPPLAGIILRPTTIGGYQNG